MKKTIPSVCIKLHAHRIALLVLLTSMLALLMSPSLAVELELRCPSSTRVIEIAEANSLQMLQNGDIQAYAAGDDACDPAFDDSDDIKDLNGTALLRIDCPSGGTNELVIADTKDAEFETSMSAFRVRQDGSIENQPKIFAYPASNNACIAPEVLVTSFTVNSVKSRGVAYYDSGEPTELVVSWSSKNAETCVPFGNLPAWTGKKELGTAPENGMLKLSLADIDGARSYSLGIQCQRGPTKSDISSVSVCPSSRRLPPTWKQRVDCVNASTNAGVACQYYEDVFGGEWAVSTGKTRNIVMSKNRAQEFVSLQFDIEEDQVGSSGTWQTRGSIQVGYGEVNAPVIVTVSHCPGDFDRNEIERDGGCYYSDLSRFTYPYWAAPEGSLIAGSCRLAVGENFFWNIIHSDSEPGTLPEKLEVSERCDVDAGCGAQWTPYAGG